RVHRPAKADISANIPVKYRKSLLERPRTYTCRIPITKQARAAFDFLTARNKLPSGLMGGGQWKTVMFMPSGYWSLSAVYLEASPCTQFLHYCAEISPEPTPEPFTIIW